MNRYDALRILGIGPEATVEEARRAYREQVKLWHPDRYSDNSALKSLALKNVQDANRAWAYLRSRLPLTPARPATKVATKPSQDRQQEPAGHETLAACDTSLIAFLRRCIERAAPLIGRIRRIKVTGIVGWLRDDPNCRYRPWYRYSEKDREHTPKSGSPTFSQTLTDVLQARNNGALTSGARPHRRKNPTSAGPAPSDRRDARGRDLVDAANTAERGRES